MMSPETIEFDPHGDIKLQVGQSHESESIIFTACSRTLARVSPVFERMLYGRFIEAKTRCEGDWIVKLPEDKALPLAIFLNIAHGHFNRVPRTLPVDDLYDLTVLSNYYDGTRILEPWINGWMSTVEEDVKGSNMTMAKALWISWEFGREDCFTRIARRMLLESDGEMVADNPVFQDLKMPPEIIERISAIRILTIKKLLDVFQNMVENLIVVDEKPRWCRHAQWMGPHRCESMILGSMTFCLARAGLWPLPNPADTQDSIVGLHRKMTTLIIHDIGRVGEKPMLDHRECNPGPFLLAELGKIFNEMANPVTKLHAERMDEQALRLVKP